MKYLLSVLSLVFILASCAHEESPEIKEALAIQKNCQSLAADFEKRVTEEIIEVRSDLADSLNYSDSAKIMGLHSKLEALVAAQLALEHWNSNVVEVPGHHHHEEGEVCTHDHSRDAILEGLPDEEILNMQKELKSQLMELIKKSPVRINEE